MLNPVMSVLLSAYLAFSGFYMYGSTASIDSKSAESVSIDKVIEEHQPNELGKIMVVMYHNLVETEAEEGDYARSYANFEKDLIRLHENGYAPIRMSEWISGKIDVPAGKTPVVLTFDDGHPTDIQLDKNGKPTEQCVVGIMEKVQKKYLDFVPKATFYLNGPAALGDLELDKKKIDYLMSHGYEIQNHTSNHLHLNAIPLDQAREEIVSQAKRLEKFTKSKNFHLALPFGQRPDNYAELVRGDWLGEYKMLSSVNVGWDPIPSVYDKDFDPYDIHRVTCGEDDFELYFWMDDFESVPQTRFYSDGNPDTITFPVSEKDKFNEEGMSGFQKIIYDDESLKIIEE